MIVVVANTKEKDTISRSNHTTCAAAAAAAARETHEFIIILSILSLNLNQKRKDDDDTETTSLLLESRRPTDVCFGLSSLRHDKPTSVCHRQRGVPPPPPPLRAAGAATYLRLLALLYLQYCTLRIFLLLFHCSSSYFRIE